MRIVIHGGMFKTGTTALQQSLHKQRRKLSSMGVIYPESDTGQHSRLLNVRSPSWAACSLRQLALEADAGGASVLMLSGETVSALSSSQFEQLTQCFDGWPVDYVFCFRHWSTYLPSRWAQNCIRRDSQTFGSYLHHALEPSLAHFDARFDLILTRAAASGAAGVHAVSYEHAMAAHGSTCIDVLKASQLPQQAVDLIGRSRPWCNGRASPLDVELCRLLNGVAAYHRNLRQDDLFWSYAAHQECGVFFDFLNKLSTLPVELMQGIGLLIRSCKPRQIALPQFKQLEALLSDTHLHRFSNVGGDAIFGAATEQKRFVEAYELEWPQCLEDVRKVYPRLLDAFPH